MTPEQKIRALDLQRRIFLDTREVWGRAVYVPLNHPKMLSPGATYMPAILSNLGIRRDNLPVWPTYNPVIDMYADVLGRMPDPDGEYVSGVEGGEPGEVEGVTYWSEELRREKHQDVYRVFALGAKKADIPAAQAWLRANPETKDD